MKVKLFRTRLVIFFNIVFLLTGVAVVPGFAQKSKADKLYDNKLYDAAARIYEKEIVKAKDAGRYEMLLKTGLCYLNTNRPQTALSWLEQAANYVGATGDAWYRYGLALQQTGNYLEAVNAFEQCLRLQPKHPMAEAQTASCRFALQNHQVNPYANFRLASEINTAGGEFGISTFTDGMIFYSEADVPTENSKVDQRTGLQYAESYMARLLNGKLVNPQPADFLLPKYVSAGLFTYDSIARCVYFNYCDPDNDRCGIYVSRQRSGKWSDPEPVLLNKKNQVTGHPAIADKGRRLYFTSNSPEGIGQTDIWCIDQNQNGKWGEPVNAGSTINTLGREEFPFVYADSLLFFASDGHIGYGGLDIFCSVIRGHSFDPPVNLRRPYNSQGDDFNLVITENIGLMSSTRNESVSDDIYMFDGLPTVLYLGGNITNADNHAAIAGARLTLSVDGKAVQHTVSDSLGYYGFFLKPGESPMMYVRTTGFRPALMDVKPGEVKQFTDINRDIKLQLSTMLPVVINLYDKTTGRPVFERGIICFNNDGETQIMRTDAEGSFKLSMQEDQREYWIKFPDGYYLTESVFLNEEQRTYSLSMQPLNGELFTGWIRFKKGSTEVLEMSQPLVPRIASILKANPGIVFQITGFADQSSEIKQPDLANKRAEYIVRRLIEEGVDKRMLTVVPSKNPAKNNAPANEERDAGQRRIEIRAKR